MGSDQGKSSTNTTRKKGGHYTLSGLTTELSKKTQTGLINCWYLNH